MRAVGFGAVVDVEDVDDAVVFIDPVDDPVRAAEGSMTASQRAEQRFADAVRVDREGGLAELQHGSGDCLGKPLGPSGRVLYVLRDVGADQPWTLPNSSPGMSDLLLVNTRARD
jgi:hypothetical protein